ncbi:ABC transporter ATP-binding protein [Microbacterium imperiale]|uniref:ABC transporter ATP-binding protein n=1 Tax=Microbacterium imperiale TaxID=33884 RepID=A0A9W6HIG5_9MICO|nr:ABC transporter ATP-binding protein [Microbacterium imperiale]MBP2421329.1 iron complex transport system ATP-binding protein [Microbacterium imperiale]MDS0199563.1 ABC transporter ATP-binding protein [Microbacterium imperiale]BFE41668.1 ABC transporter ATP-binding protein [Microbacterium imperiale]GLJ80619.1 ABC transporter ATP-binding protein [Microbacterium imperiale]
MTLHARDVSWARGGSLVVDGVTVEPEPGRTLGLLGPNGSGKSSLLRVLHGLVRPTAGWVTLDGEDLTRVGRRRAARTIASVSQHADTEVDITVRDVARLGRIPHRGTFGGDAKADEAAVDRALAHVGLTEHAERLWHTLSGGERQRAQIARALAQEPRELLLDEPTNHLDIRHQLELLDLVCALPVTTVVAIHDLNLAAMYCDSVLVMQQGRVVAGGPPREVLTAPLISSVYGVEAEVAWDERRGHPVITYTRSR